MTADQRCGTCRHFGLETESDTNDGMGHCVWDLDAEGDFPEWIYLASARKHQIEGKTCLTWEATDE